MIVRRLYIVSTPLRKECAMLSHRTLILHGWNADILSASFVEMIPIASFVSTSNLPYVPCLLLYTYIVRLIYQYTEICHQTLQTFNRMVLCSILLLQIRVSARWGTNCARLSIQFTVSVMKPPRSPRWWSFVRGIHRSSVVSPDKGWVVRTFDISFDVRLCKLLDKESTVFISDVTEVIQNNRIDICCTTGKIKQRNWRVWWRKCSRYIHFTYWIYARKISRQFDIDRVEGIAIIHYNYKATMLLQSNGLIGFGVSGYQ